MYQIIIDGEVEETVMGDATDTYSLEMYLRKYTDYGVSRDKIKIKNLGVCDCDGYFWICHRRGSPDVSAENI